MPVTNEILVEECRQKTEDYLGHKEKIIYATVWDWVKMQIELVSKVYASAVCRTIWELFYDPETKKVRNLRDTPYSIGIARDMLLVLRNTTNEFEKKIQETRREYLGSDNNVVITQEQKVGMLEADMKGEKKDRQFQERYISESQKLLELKLWEILLSACELCINKYKEVNKILWEEIGGHDRGWVTFLDNCNRFITDRQGEVDNRREKMRQNKARTYVPDKYGEQYLYNDRVKRRHIVDIILGEMRWGLGKFEDEFLTALLEDGLKPDDLKNFKILLLSPPLPKDAAAEGRYSDRRITSVRLEQHYPEELKRVAESKIEDLKNLTIWDAIYYNYISRPDGIVTKEGKTTASIYAAGIVEDILRQSGLLLDIHHSAEKGKGRPVINQYIMSYALTSLAPQPNSKEDLAKCVFDEIQEKLAGIKDESKMDKQITGLKVINGVSLFEWGYYKKCQEGYGKLMSEYSTYPVHLTIHEKMAARLEQKLYDELLLRRNEQLHYTVVRYLEPKFETFAYALVAGLFGEAKQIRKDNGYQLCYQLEVIAPSGRSIPISLETDLERLLDVYLAQNGEGKALRAEIERRWDNFIKSSKNIKEELSDYLKKFDISDINTEGLLEVAHFKLAVKAIILLFLDSR